MVIDCIIISRLGVHVYFDIAACFIFCFDTYLIDEKEIIVIET